MIVIFLLAHTEAKKKAVETGGQCSAGRSCRSSSENIQELVLQFSDEN